MDAWTYQQGFPLLTVEKRNTVWVVSQQPFGGVVRYLAP